MNKPLRVCFIRPKAYPLFVPRDKGIFGGAEVDLYMLSTNLAKDKDFDVHFVVGDYGQRDLQQIGGVKLIKSLKVGSYSPAAVFKLVRAMKKADADIYFVKTMSAGLLLVWLFCAVCKKKFFIRTAHSSHCDGSYLRKFPFLKPFYKLAFKNAAAVFTQTQADEKALLVSLGVGSKTVANAHEINPLPPQSREYFLWIARSADFKNPYMMLQIAKELPQIKFVMVCPAAFNDKNYGKLKYAASHIKNLEFITRASFTQTHNFFAGAKAFINTSESEGFANTFIQAAINSTPILSYKVNPDDFLTKNDCGLCADGDCKKLIEIIKNIEADRQLRERLGQNGLEYAKRNHDIEKILPVYKDLFRKAVTDDD